ncbi:MAG: phosphoribosylamine--glycine ligase, partial [Clostridia bacterium]|nr:phosphoribosylamine--glycine ligase [Clostridia bacterium]
MKVLVVGGGGREHAICHKLSQSPKLTKLFCAPGNAGIAQCAEIIDIRADDISGIVSFAVENAIDLVVVGPDDQLAAGMVDAVQARGIKAFGPTKAAAQIESSKTFAKEVMKKAGIPTAGYNVFSDVQQAFKFAETCPLPIVIKADGLALGKGVIICEARPLAMRTVRECMQEGRFGEAGRRVLFEEFLSGPEMSLLAFCDGKTVLPMVTAQDYKRAQDGDQGLNTGGMGSVSPALHEQAEDISFAMQHVLQPCVDTLRDMGCPFKGVLYAGLMRTADGLKVIEFNARFGDPETQVVLPRLKTDLLDVLLACVDGRLHEIKLEWDDRAAVCVVMASGGYPGAYKTGYAIEGLDAKSSNDSTVYHAGTKLVQG